MKVSLTMPLEQAIAVNQQKFHVYNEAGAGLVIPRIL